MLYIFDAQFNYSIILNYATLSATKARHVKLRISTVRGHIMHPVCHKLKMSHVQRNMCNYFLSHLLCAYSYYNLGQNKY